MHAVAVSAWARYVAKISSGDVVEYKADGNEALWVARQLDTNAVSIRGQCVIM